MNDSPQPHCSSVPCTVSIFLCFTYSSQYRRRLPRRGPMNGGVQRTYVGVPEDEALVELVLGPVHLAANDAEEGLAVDEHLDAILLDCLVKGARLVHVFEVVRQPAAAAVSHPNLDELGVRL